MLIRICINLYFRIWKLIWWPIAIIKARWFSLLIFGVVAYVVYVLFFEENNEGTLNRPAEMQTKAPEGVVIQPVLQYENGNSKFSSDLIPQMQPEELQHYSAIFYQVMDAQQTGQPYPWEFYNIRGSLTPHKSFKNKLGLYCRYFDEVLKVGETQQNINGLACQQRAGGWCKLRRTSTPACGLGREPGFGAWWSDTKRDFGDIFR